jgi:dihydroorotase
MNADTTKTLTRMNTDQEHGSLPAVSHSFCLPVLKSCVQKHTNDKSLIQAMTAGQSSFAGVLSKKNSDVGDGIGALWRTEQSV